MRLPPINRLLEANAGRPAWVAWTALSGIALIAAGAALVAVVVFGNALRSAVILCSAVTLIVSGVTLAAIATAPDE